MFTPTRTARWTGGAYLGLALAGMLGFLVLRPQLHVPGDSAATLANLVDRGALVQAAIALELLIVVAQALAAVGFYALFRADRPVAAFSVATFGMANAAAVLGSAAMIVAAYGLASSPSPVGDPVMIAALFAVADAFWTVGAVFFGLWLIPMGWFALSTRRFPRVLGWILVIGGAGYVLDAFLSSSAPWLPSVVGDVMVIPATIGELWMIGYLLVCGIRPALAVSPAGAIPEPVAATRDR
ncbi:DUF4386 domain-containing protein [Microbacterium allomyrinae]|uniref:DUF4386 domain-containing protein n=1 Tax=Microbacterium allomyrinae TaxID=2830666 RepID=A0A9X1LTC2_9MICO|nr:DUF4386 domain-containing protein [Microbacterium allomyrinae]MCC2031669.1 DUF4386 domain-containing protein [Microbacterium allomyrinae]